MRSREMAEVGSPLANSGITPTRGGGGGRNTRHKGTGRFIWERFVRTRNQRTAESYRDQEAMPSQQLPDKIKRMKTLKLKEKQVNWKDVYLRLDLPDPDGWIINPDLPIRQLWDLVMLVCVVYVAAAVPPQLAFPILETYEIDLFLYFAFGFDILLSFITGYHEGSAVIMSQKRVAIHYMSTWFVVDVLATFPFEYVVQNAAQGATTNQAAKATRGSRVGKSIRVVRISRFLRLLRLARVLKLLKFGDFLKWVSHYLTIHPAIFRLVKALVLQFYMCHLLACLWCWVPYMEYSEGVVDNWPRSRGLHMGMYETGEWSEVYLHAVYWAFTTMTTVGYGDVAAYSHGEMIFATLGQILGVTFYGFIIGSINAVVESLDKRNAAFARKHTKYQDFIYGAKLPDHLKSRVVAHFRSWQDEKRVQTFLTDSEDVLCDLPADLRHEVLFHMHRALISRIPFFQGKPMGFIAGVVTRVKFVVVPVNTAIVKQREGRGRHGEVFFILRGTVIVYKNNKIVGDLTEGAILGETSVLYNKKATATIITKTRCELASCPANVFMKMLETHPQVKEEVHALAEQRRESKFHAGLPTWWFKVSLLGSMGADSSKAAMARLRRRGTKKISNAMLRQDMAAFVIQRSWIACKIRSSKKKRLKLAAKSKSEVSLFSPSRSQNAGLSDDEDQVWGGGGGKMSATGHEVRLTKSNLRRHEHGDHDDVQDDRAVHFDTDTMSAQTSEAASRRNRALQTDEDSKSEHSVSSSMARWRPDKTKTCVSQIGSALGPVHAVASFPPPREVRGMSAAEITDLNPSSRDFSLRRTLSAQSMGSAMGEDVEALAAGAWDPRIGKLMDTQGELLVAVRSLTKQVKDIAAAAARTEAGLAEYRQRSHHVVEVKGTPVSGEEARAKEGL